jgi:hypothetical protein
VHHAAANGAADESGNDSGSTTPADPAPASGSSAANSPSAAAPSGSGTPGVTVGAGRDDVPVTTPTESETVAAEAGIQAAVDTFLQRTVGLTSAGCDCAVALALAFDGNAAATAAPVTSGLVPGVAGQTGDAVSLSYSGAGPADADATSGAAGNAMLAATAPPASQPGQLPGAASPDEFAGVVRDVVAALVAANGQPPSITDPLSGYTARSADTVSVRVVSTGPLGSCVGVSGCAVAVSIAVNGTASATLDAPDTCSGPVGAATAVAISVAHPAHAAADRGSGSTCPGTTPALPTAVSASAGNTGAAYGISLTAGGPSTAAAQSGALGHASAVADGDANAPESVAISGSTGDSAGIAIGVDAANADASTGDSGAAAARCSKCALAAGGTSLARSGDTGSSYALSGAGETATATSSSGESGPASADSIGTKTTAVGAAPTVMGRSGDTGNAFATAIDLTTWVTVNAHTGAAGAVTSMAKGAPEGSTKGSGHTTTHPSQQSGTSVQKGPHGSSGAKPGLISPSGTHRSSGSGASPGSGAGAAPAHPTPASANATTPAGNAAPHTAQPEPAPAPDAVSNTALAAPRQRVSVVHAARPHVIPAQTAGLLGVGMVGMPLLFLSGAALVAIGVTQRRRRSKR